MMRRPGFRGQLPRRGFELILRAGDDGDIDAFTGELARDGFADTQAAAGDDRVFALQPQIHRVTSWPAARAGGASRAGFYRR